jgi:hypothetical protein
MMAVRARPVRKLETRRMRRWGCNERNDESAKVSVGMKGREGNEETCSIVEELMGRND